MDDFWTDDSRYTNPPYSDSMVEKLEKRLGYRFPHSYLSLLRSRNGGVPRRTYHPLVPPTRCHGDFIEISYIRGLGGDFGIRHGGIELADLRDSPFPEVGLIVAHCPSAGHDAVMLDYRDCGPEGEPGVIHVETEVAGPVEVSTLAPNFQVFVDGLIHEGQLPKSWWRFW